MIRLIGRYWHEDSVYKVKLKAVYKTDTLTRTVVVKKPDKLGDKDNKTKDVFGKEINLDSVIIKYSGIFGIPPQILKAQVKKESSFRPSYLYEPFLDFQRQLKDSSRIYSNQYCIKDSLDVGSPGIPTDHIGLYNTFGNRITYPGYVGTIWKYYNKYKDNLYQRVNSKGKVMYKFLQQIWSDSLVTPIKDLLIKKENIEETAAKLAAEKLASDSLSEYLKCVYMYGKMNKVLAQTRIMASYGFMHLVYYFGCLTDREYPADANHLPEMLSLTDTSFYYGLKHFENKFKETVGFRLNAEYNWKDGFEKCLSSALNAYNGNNEYSKIIMGESKNYMPSIRK